MKNLEIIMDKKSFFILTIIISFLFGFFLNYFISDQFVCEDKIKTIFSPSIKEEMIDLIRSANNSIDIQVYQFSSMDIANELLIAKNRGVKVRIILERRLMGGINEKMYSYLYSRGFEVFFANTFYFPRTHSKFIIIDGKIVIVGSFNFSEAGLVNNREAGVVIENEKIAKEFLKIFENDFILAKKT